MSNIKSILLLIFLSGCATIQPILPQDFHFDENSGYVAGEFSRDATGGFSFVLVNLESGTEYFMSLGEDPILYTQKKNDYKATAIKVPPGTYKIESWARYAPLAKNDLQRHSIENVRMKTPFVVRKGDVFYLGKYSVSSTTTRRVVYWPTVEVTMNFSIQPNIISPEEGRDALVRSYPALRSAPFNCLLCINSPVQ